MKKSPLTLTRIIEAAAAVADDKNLAAVSMRNVAKHLGVEAMSLYHHVHNKGALLNELTDWFFSQVDLPAPSEDWREWLATYADAVRAALSAHPWALGLVNSQPAPGPAQLHHINRPLGVLFDAGFTVADAIHTLSAVDAYVFGFVITNQNLPFTTDTAVTDSDFSPELTAALADYPHLARVAEALTSEASFTYVDEFTYGLDLLLAEIEQRHRNSLKSNG